MVPSEVWPHGPPGENALDRIRQVRQKGNGKSEARENQRHLRSSGLRTNVASPGPAVTLR